MMFAALAFAIAPPSMESLQLRRAAFEAVRPVAAAFVARGRTGIANACLRTEAAGGLHVQTAPFMLKPQPLPPPNAGTGHPPAEVVRLQRQYRRLMELGFREEAAEVASQLTGQWIQLASDTTADPAPAQYRVGYRGTDRDFVAADPTPFVEAKSQTLSAEYHGAAIDVALAQVHRATGVTVRIALASDDRPRVFAVGGALSLERTLDLICGSCGCTWTVRRGEVIVERPTATVLRDAGLPILR